MNDIDDVSGRIGDLSGRIGDLSGRIGDLSGGTIREVQGILLEDRRDERALCLEIKVNRLESEILGIARWLDTRLRLIEEAIPAKLEARIKLLEGMPPQVESRLKNLDDRVRKLETPQPPTQPTH